MKAIAWRLQTGNKDKFIYRLQIDGLKAVRAINKAYKTLGSWNVAAEGFNPKNKETLLVFSKEFADEGEWIDWAKNVPLNLVEHNRKGNPKPIKLGLNVKRKRRRKVSA